MNRRAANRYRERSMLLGATLPVTMKMRDRRRLTEATAKSWNYRHKSPKIRMHGTKYMNAHLWALRWLAESIPEEKTA